MNERSLFARELEIAAEFLRENGFIQVRKPLRSRDAAAFAICREVEGQG